MAKVEQMDPRRLPEYQKGAEGCIAFIEENVKFQVPSRNSPVPRWMYPTELPDEPDPITGKSFHKMWEEQKKELREALKMRNGKFVYRVIVFCWPRGEGKSLMVVLIQLWKFFCFPQQLIVFGALSKDQTKFVHYDITQSIILNSPKLLNVIGKRNVQQGKLFLKGKQGDVISSVQPISSYSGIVSNITGYTFSEIFDLKDEKFFVQLDGSIRNIINALGTIDSTVSAKGHVLHRLYRGAMDGSDRLTYFSHRSAPNATPDEYWHPHMDEDQLRSYQSKFQPADFDRYFRNVWGLDSGKLFPPPVVQSIFNYAYISNDTGKSRLDDGSVLEICNAIHYEQAKLEKSDRRRNPGAKRQRRRVRRKKVESTAEKIVRLENKLVPMDNVYTLYKGTIPKLATVDDLHRLGNLFDTNWSIHAGIDRSDPMANNPMARTIVTVTAKGLTGSRSSRNIIFKDPNVPEYIYLLLHLAHVEDATLEGIKRELSSAYLEYDGLDSVCSERWGAWDLAPWCEEYDIHFEAVFPSYDLQRKAFTELYLAVRNGRFKTPTVIVPGSKTSNILSEEMETFDYNPDKKWYGSPQKDEQGGVQDDSIFSLGWGIYGGREFGIDDFRERRGSTNFGVFVPDERNLARYGF